MRAKLPKLNLLTLSSLIYNLLLYAYPVPFRREYGQQMAQLFRDEARDTLQGSGRAGLFGLWFHVLYDLVKSALAEHLWEVFNMPLKKLLRFSGPTAMIAGPFWAFLYISDFELGTVMARGLTLIFTVLLSAFALSGTSVTLPQRNQAIGSSLIGITGLLVFGALGAYILFTDTESSLVWELFLGGFWLLLIGFAFMGIVALSADLSKIIGVSLLAMALFSLVIWGSGGENRQIQIGAAICLGMAWIALGFGLLVTKLDMPDDALPA